MLPDQREKLDSFLLGIRIAFKYEDWEEYNKDYWEKLADEYRKIGKGELRLEDRHILYPSWTGHTFLQAAKEIEDLLEELSSDKQE